MGFVPSAPAADATPAMFEKVRLRFHKGGDLRLLSHHDLLRCFERLLRRAELPVRATQGFHPKPRVVFALSLPLGVIGRDEVVEIELLQPMNPDEVRDRVARACPPGLSVLSVRGIPARATAQVRAFCYRLPLPPEVSQREVAERAAEVLARSECWLDRTRPPVRRIDVRPFLRDLRVREGGLDMELWLTPSGTARPEEVLELVGLAGLLRAGAVLERTRLELADETPPATHEGTA